MGTDDYDLLLRIGDSRQKQMVVFKDTPGTGNVYTLRHTPQNRFVEVRKNKDGHMSCSR